MEFIGVDIGNYKTVIASSKDNGKIYGDEQGKRFVRTVMELSRPVRKFGNGVTSDIEEMLELRHRGFRDFLDVRSGWDNMSMFLRYLDRIIKKNTPTHPSVCMTIPTYFKEKERRMLIDIAHASEFKLAGFIMDVSAIGVFACLRRENAPGEFMVFDFGFSKSTAGLFSFEKNVFKPLYTKVAKIGAMQLDEKLVDIIIVKHSLERTPLIQEKIRRNLDKIKTTLNSTEHCNLQVFLSENPVNISITQEEYRDAVQNEIDDLRSFVETVMEETKFDGVIEVIGGNSSSFLVKDLLDDRISYQVTLDTSDSSAIGAALGMACNSLKTRYVIHDVIGRELSVKIQGENVKPTVIFKNNDLVNGAPKMITYNRKSGFTVEVVEDSEVIATIAVEKPETEDAEAVHISLSINRFGIVDVVSVECKSGAEYKYEVFSIAELDIENIKALEAKYREEELRLERIGTMRNELETMAVDLGDALHYKFGKIFTEDDVNKVKEIAMDLFDIPPSETIAQEEEVRESILSRLGFVSEKLDDYRRALAEDLEKCKSVINEFKNENPKIFTPSFYKLQGLLYKIDEYLKGFDLNIFNAGSFDEGVLIGIKDDVQNFLKKAKKEVVEKKEAEERIKKEAEDKAKAEEPKDEEAPEKDSISGDDASDTTSVDE